MIVSSEWRFLETGPASGAWNMAFDEALMESVRHGAAPALRFYRWSPPCLSLGHNQPAIGGYDLDRLSSLGVDVVRRPTGGRAVLHEDELTYSVVASDREFGGVRRAYRAINRILVEGIRRLGAAATICDTREAPPTPSSAPCFSEPVAGEVLALGRKLIGSAQVRSRGVLLQHGSLPLRPGVISRQLGDVVGGPGAMPAYLDELLARPPAWDTLTASLSESWRDVVGTLTAAVPEATELSRARELVARYESPEWTWRR